MTTPQRLEMALVQIPDEHVLIPVPNDRVQEVLSLLARRSAPRTPPRPFAPEPESEPWTPENLRALTQSMMPKKQWVILERLAQRSPAKVFATELRELLAERGLLEKTNYPGKALGGTVLALERRARWFQEAPLFERGCDHDRREAWYRLDPQYKACLQGLLV